MEPAPLKTKAQRYWETRVPREKRVSKYLEEIRKLAGEGKSGYEIARELQIWPSAVYKIAKAHGIALPRRR